MKRALIVSLLFFATGCKKDPVGRIVNPLGDGAVPQVSGVYVIYSDELKTGGGLGFVPTAGNQGIDLFDQSEPRRTRNQIRYLWNGQSVGGQINFAGFSLLITPDFSTLNSTPHKDLSFGGYTKLTMMVRGRLGDGVSLRIEGPGSGSSTAARTDITTLSNTWQQITLSVPSADFSTVRIFMTLTFQYDRVPRTDVPSDGGEVYLDDIQFEQ
jgi:hypothetical protein